MSNFLGLRTAIYRANELEKAKAWYTSALGVSPYFDQPFYVGFNVGGFELGLVPDEGTGTAGDGVITYWGVDNVQAIYNNLLQAGATAHESPHDVGGDIVVASVRDPWGNVLGIIYNPHFGKNHG
jgi:catechol 2,3-dioxygenase-like lactoylglutathione lyase family enzyme